MGRVGRLLGVIIVASLMGGCSLFKPAKEAGLPGKREMIYLAPSTGYQNPAFNSLFEGPQAGGPCFPPSQNLWGDFGKGSLPPVLLPSWRRSFSSPLIHGSFSLQRPLLLGDKGYFLDEDSNLICFALGKPGVVWRVPLIKKPKSLRAKKEVGASYGGNLCFHGHSLYGVTDQGEAFRVSLKGDILWKRPISGPCRGGPVTDGSQVFFHSIFNRLDVLDAQTGRSKWCHDFVPETLISMGCNQPVLGEDQVYAASFSGHLEALRKDGELLWSQSLFQEDLGPLPNQAPLIKFPPVKVGDMIYLGDGRSSLTAFHGQSGEKVWSAAAEEISDLCVVGNMVAFVDGQGEAVVKNRFHGKDYARLALPKEGGKVDQWSSMVCVGKRFLAVSSKGLLVAVDPVAKELVCLTRLKLSKDERLVPISPMFHGGHLWVWTENKTLIRFSLKGLASSRPSSIGLGKVAC